MKWYLCLCSDYIYQSFLYNKHHLSLCHQAITARDSMAKSLYSALFDWIVLRINHALLNKRDMEESVPVRHKRSHTQDQSNLKDFILM